MEAVHFLSSPCFGGKSDHECFKALLLGEELMTLSQVHSGTSEPRLPKASADVYGKNQCRSRAPPLPSSSPFRPAVEHSAQLEHSCSGTLPPGPAGILLGGGVL